MPRAMPVSSGDSSSVRSGPRRRTIWALSQALSRASTLSRAGPVSCSSATMRGRGSNSFSPGSSFATGSPSQRMMPSFESTSDESAAAEKRSARASISLARPCWAALRSAFASSPVACGSGTKWKPCRWPTCWPSTVTSPVAVISASITRVLSQATHEHARAPVDEALGEPLMEGVGQAVLYPTGHGLPMLGVLQPVGAVRDEGPGADLRDAVRQRVDVAVRAVEHRDLAREPVRRHRSVLHQEAEELADEVGMRRPARPCGSPAPGRRPTGAARRRASERSRGCRPRARRARARARPRRTERADQPVLARLVGEALLQLRERREVEVRVAPLQDAHGIEGVVLERLDDLGVEGRAAPGGAEGAVAHVAPGAAGDLAELGRMELAEAEAVELLVGRRRRRGRRRG